MQDLDLVAVLDTQIRFAPADGDAAVHCREPHRARAQGAKPLHDPLVLLTGIGHQKVIHSGRVGEAADLAALRGDHARRMPEAVGEIVQFLVGAVDEHKGLLAGSDVLQKGIEVGQAAAELDDEHG